MKISIITPCLNAQNTISDTLQSVVVQSYHNFEYIIVDGGSTDGTLAIVESYKTPSFKIISGPDVGLYDAMNKGIQAASGDIIGILNADDFYYDNTVLETVARTLADDSIDGCYADLRYVHRQKINTVVRYWRAGEYRPSNLANGWIPPHPTFFVKKRVYDQYGLFCTDLKIAADYELMLRFLLKKIIIKYIKKPLVCMREGGMSARGLGQRMAGWRELKMAWLKNAWRPPFLFVLRRLLFKVGQYFV